MTATFEQRPTISRSVGSAVQTRVDSESPVSPQNQLAQQFRDAWQRLIDERLLAWLNDPSQLEDEGVEQPSATILRLSLDLAEKFRDDGLPPADSIVPDPNGGIVFERRQGDIAEVFHVWEEDGAIEYQRFHGGQLLRRRMLWAKSGD